MSKICVIVLSLALLVFSPTRISISAPPGAELHSLSLVPPDAAGFAVFGVSALSEDGMVVGGSVAVSQGFVPAVWRVGEGIEILEQKPEQFYFTSHVNAISPDGKSATGAYPVANINDTSEVRSPGFLWTADHGVRPLVDRVPPGVLEILPGAIDASGQIVAGSIRSAATNPGGPLAFQLFQWTETGGLDILGDPARSWVLDDMASDGSVMAGLSSPLGGWAPQAFRWDQGRGLTSLSDTGLSPAEPSRAYRVIGEGEIQHVIGMVGAKPFVWTDAGVFVLNDELEGDVWAMGGSALPTQATLTALIEYQPPATGDGTPLPAPIGMIWTAGQGSRTVESYLRDELGLGDQIEGWRNITGKSITRNARHIAGMAMGPGDQPLVWMARLPEPTHWVAVPEPGTWLSAALGLTALLFAGRRRA